MAQLKDLIVTGASRLIGDVYTSQIQISKIKAPTAANGTSYGAGISGQTLMTNGTTVYWGTPASDVSFDYGETLPSSASEGDIFFQLSNINANTSTITADKINTTAATSNTNYYLVGAVAAGEQSPYISTANSSGTSNTAGVYFNGATGVLSGAAWNDYAEFREKRNIDGIPYGFCVIENGDDTVSFSTQRLQPCGQIVSDTYGFTLGKEENNLPIAVCGRVLAYPYEDRKTFFVGDAVCTAPDGKVSKMTREEIKEYPDRIIGYVSSIPNYQVWGDQKIQVKGRIWIKVK